MDFEARIQRGSSPGYAGIRTFLKLPHETEREKLKECDFAAVGLPFDTAVTYRPGARFGPAAIREASSAVRKHNPALGVAPLEILDGLDYGDVAVVPGNTEASLDLMDDALSEIVGCGVIPVGLGGDHLVTLPVLRSLARHHSPLALLHFDAHSDTSERVHGEKYNHATPFRRAIEEGVVLPEKTIQIGIRGSVSDPGGLDRARRAGVTVLDAPTMLNMAPGEVKDRVEEVVVGAPLYVTFDIDFLDASCAPGTGVPEVGGPSTAQALSYLREMDLSAVVGMDLVEVLPDLDPSRITALAAANILFDMISLVARARQQAAG